MYTRKRRYTSKTPGHPAYVARTASGRTSNNIRRNNTRAKKTRYYRSDPITKAVTKRNLIKKGLSRNRVNSHIRMRLRKGQEPGWRLWNGWGLKPTRN